MPWLVAQVEGGFGFVRCTRLNWAGLRYRLYRGLFSGCDRDGGCWRI
jgi:hypothetical protein